MFDFFKKISIPKGKELKLSDAKIKEFSKEANSPESLSDKAKNLPKLSDIEIKESLNNKENIGLSDIETEQLNQQN